MSAKVNAAILNNWEECNAFLKDASEKDAAVLLDLEKAGRKRIQYLLRLHGRFNRERARRERAELVALTA